MDIKIISVIVGAILGGLISSAGFLLRTKREIKEKVNESLFQLLEVWSLVAMLKFSNSDSFSKQLVEEIKVRFPAENIGENEKDIIMQGMVKSIPMMMGNRESLDGHSLEAYKSSVKELAKIYPMLAFDLNKNDMLINLLSYIDTIASDQISSSEEALLSNMKAFMFTEALSDLESGLLELSKLSGKKTKKDVEQRIARINKRLEKLPSSAFDEYIDSVIAPLVQHHYDSLGLENPNIVKNETNKKIQVTPMAPLI
ncbi:hypothetical protein NI389_00510 [Pseudoalteromonas xiamenensis]|uniref:hypothetical protein n=1 Tax=Pseudoalteromonas xiamenensis TaxID=882626 RepID=UPI0027E544D3|nr:hypothetical protein [Pseudoalteromonas xiamenensis]WMN59946.1 hypothetical protein NI389_00510 [Pseudoalteromonas xiamenensis]